MMRFVLCFWLGFALVNSGMAEDATVKFSIVQSQATSVVIVEALPPVTLRAIEKHVRQGNGSNNYLKVYVANKQNLRDPDTPAVIGSTSLDGKALIFTPKYPLVPGLAYLVELSGNDKSPMQRGIVSLPAVVFERSTRVMEIYPTASKLPENLLKFYIHFSAPMSGGEAYRHVEILDLSGKQLEHPFLEVAEELWDPRGERLTLILDPARVKRGLVPREEEGPILHAGRKYRLTVKDSWEDERGARLVSSAVKEFEVTDPDYSSPQVSKWRVVPPDSDVSQKLVIDFGESLDHALVTRCIEVIDARGKRIEGAVALAKQESVWSFAADSSWQPGEYELKIKDIIEDLAGNSIAKPFEVDRFDAFEPPTSKRVRLTFRISSAK